MPTIRSKIRRNTPRPNAGYDPFAGARQAADQGDSYQTAAFQYIRFRRFSEALNALQNSQNRNARWYYLSALANNGLGNQVTALEHIRKAVSMEPANQEYLWTLEQIEQGGTAYRRQADTFRGFTFGGSPCTNLFLCFLANIFCCGGRMPLFFCC